MTPDPRDYEMGTYETVRFRDWIAAKAISEALSCMSAKDLAAFDGEAMAAAAYRLADAMVKARQPKKEVK